MAYTPTVWEDSPSTATPITAAQLNKMETGIDVAHDDIVALDTRLDAEEAATAAGATQAELDAHVNDASAAHAAAAISFNSGGVPGIAASEVQAAIAELANEKEFITNKGVASGYAGLDASALVPLAQLPSIPASKVAADVATQAELDAINTALDARLDAEEAQPDIPTVVNGLWLKGTAGAAVWETIGIGDVATLSGALTGKEDKTNKGTGSGYAPLDSASRVPMANLPVIPPTHVDLAMGNAVVTMVANEARLFPIPSLLVAFVMSRFAYRVSTSAGNLDVGIYYSDDESTFTRLASSGSFACPASATSSSRSLSATLTPVAGRRWYAAIVSDGAPALVGLSAPSNGSYLKATSFPLPATLTGMTEGTPSIAIRLMI